MFCVYILCIVCIVPVSSSGLLLLYRPRDISSECAFSERLRYDISFGMGMSDTITLVFRTMSETDYQCEVDIVTESNTVYIIVVVKYPHNISVNCAANRDAFVVMKKQERLRLCDEVLGSGLQSTYFVVATRGRIRFQFLSNSSINSDLKATLYQVTATSARVKPKRGCRQRNETLCSVDDTDYCFTTGVVCDAINNCGVSDWFDERKSSCGLSIEKLGFAPVVAVVAAMFCALLAAGHILSRCLPPLAHSFFIFNANEDNRLCIDPLFRPPDVQFSGEEKVKRISLIPVSSSSSSRSEVHDQEGPVQRQMEQMTISEEASSLKMQSEEYSREPAPRKTTIKAVAEIIQNKFRSNNPFQGNNE